MQSTILIIGFLLPLARQPAQPVREVAGEQAKACPCFTEAELIVAARVVDALAREDTKDVAAILDRTRMPLPRLEQVLNCAYLLVAEMQLQETNAKVGKAGSEAGARSKALESMEPQIRARLEQEFGVAQARHPACQSLVAKRRDVFDKLVELLHRR
jgi:iron only hydrogenase large subunit-like protein